MKKVHKHRLALLLGVLIALVFFYLGVNKWIESQESFISTPPSVVRAKEPVQIKERSEPVTVETEEAEEVDEATGEVTVEVAQNPEVTPVAATGTTVAQNTGQTPPPQTQQQTNQEPEPQNTELKKEEVVVEEEPKIIIKKAEKEFVLQIGAFKDSANAQKVKTKASERGFETFIVSEDGLYKVRVRVLAGSLKEALRTVRSQFGNAFVVK